jgi:hypothetical protein
MVCANPKIVRIAEMGGSGHYYVISLWLHSKFNLPPMTFEAADTTIRGLTLNIIQHLFA